MDGKGLELKPCFLLLSMAERELMEQKMRRRIPAVAPSGRDGEQKEGEKDTSQVMTHLSFPHRCIRDNPNLHPHPDEGKVGSSEPSSNPSRSSSLSPAMPQTRCFRRRRQELP